MKVRIVILNYNGEDLLPRCLPSFLEASERSIWKPRVTVLDNRSTDQSVPWIARYVPEVHVEIANENRFLVSFNDYLKKIGDEITILMNNDIRVDPNFVDPLVRVFQDHPDAFLASPQGLDFEGKSLQSVASRARIRGGLFWASARFPGHEALRDKPGYTFAAGYGAFHRQRFLKLGGYDDLYLPGVMEDADLGFRAWREGYRSYYVPESRIYHVGQASFKRAFGPKKIMILAHRNSFLFMWKNILDPTLLAEHLLLVIPRMVYSLLRGRDELLRGFLQALPRIPEAFRRRKSYPKRARSDREIFRLANNEPIRRRYLFKKRWKRILAQVFDTLGTLLVLPWKVFQKTSPLNPKHILAIRLDSLGDAILTLPALEALGKRFPQAILTFWVTPPIEELYRAFFPQAQFSRFEGAWPNKVRVMREAHFDLGIDFRGDLRNILLMALAGIPHRWGRGGTGGGFLLTRQIQNPHQGHEAMEHLELVREDGGSTVTNVGAGLVPAIRTATRVAATGGFLPPIEGKKIVIHIGAGYPSKRWATRNYVELAQRIKQEKLGTPIYIGTGQDGTLLDPFRAEPQNGSIDLIGKTSLQELLNVLKEVDLFIGNDSGPAHLAALLEKKMVVIFSGTNDYRQWAPISRNHARIVMNPVPCSPCEERVCPLERQICLEAISVEEVLDAVKGMLAD